MGWQEGWSPEELRRRVYGGRNVVSRWWTSLRMRQLDGMPLGVLSTSSGITSGLMSEEVRLLQWVELWRRLRLDVEYMW